MLKGILKIASHTVHSTSLIFLLFSFTQITFKGNTNSLSIPESLLVVAVVVVVE